MAIEQRVTDEMDHGLNRPLTSDEVNLALQQIAPLLSPGPNGFGTCFYQQHWSTIGNKVSGAKMI